MKKIIVTIIALAISLYSFCQTRKVLFIGIDGCRWDAVVAVNAPAIDDLLTNAIYSGNGLNEYKTWSGTGWSGMLTGVWHTKHGVSDNTFAGSDYETYPDFISRAEKFNPLLSTMSVVHWGPINTNIIQAIDEEFTVATDSEVKNKAVSILNTNNPDVLFVAFDDVDHAGHTYGFSSLIPEYIQSIETTDSYVLEILTALYDRPDYANEDWLILLTTDHGGIPAGHGGGTLDERTIFNIYHNPGFSSQQISRDIISKTTTFNEAHFPAGSYARPVDQAPFEFGATQDFTVELWVKADTYTDDPAFISNKDWNSGLNPGFVISAQQGQYWKVNIGDGADRLDIQGGFIAPNEWHHLAVSFDRSGLITAYEDGAVVGFDSMVNIGNINSGLPLIINQDGTTNYGYDFDGSVKDIRIWNSVIPDSILVQWATIPVNAAHPHFGNLLANWKCEDGTGNILQDASTNANNCNVTGTIDWNLGKTETFSVFDYSGTPREPDNAVTALTWLCVPVQAQWNLDGKSWVSTCGTTAVNSLDDDAGFSVQPNPAADIITVVFQKPTGEKTILNLYDVEGNSLKHIPLPANQVKFDLPVAELVSGYYFLKIIDGKIEKTVKIVVE